MAWKLVEDFVVTEYRDGAVYKAKSLGLKWVPLTVHAPRDHIYAAPSTTYHGPMFSTSKDKPQFPNGHG